MFRPLRWRCGFDLTLEAPQLRVFSQNQMVELWHSLLTMGPDRRMHSDGIPPARWRLTPRIMFSLRVSGFISRWCMIHLNRLAKSISMEKTRTQPLRRDRCLRRFQPTQTQFDLVFAWMELFLMMAEWMRSGCGTTREVKRKSRRISTIVWRWRPAWCC